MGLTTLAHSPAEVAAWVMIQAGVGTAPTVPPSAAWPIYEPAEPNVPDNCITIKNTMGHAFGRQQIDGDMWYHPGIQVRIRAQDEATCWRKADQIRNFLTKSAGYGGIYRQIITITYDKTNSTYEVWAFNNVSQVIPLAKDTPSSKRSVATVNACIVLRQLS